MGKVLLGSVSTEGVPEVIEELLGTDIISELSSAQTGRLEVVVDDGVIKVYNRESNEAVRAKTRGDILTQ